jgi:hypothetical protein
MLATERLALAAMLNIASRRPSRSLRCTSESSFTRVNLQPQYTSLLWFVAPASLCSFVVNLHE